MKSKIIKEDAFKIASIAAVVIFGYLLFRLIFRSNIEPIITEIFAAIIGFVLTVLTTSFLLSKQTEAELTKEENIQFLNLKMNLYLELLNQLQDIILKRKIGKEDIIELRLLNQRVSFISSPEVLVAFNKFVRVFAQISQNKEINEQLVDEILDELSKLTVFIRKDLFQTDTRILNNVEIEKLILSSNDILDIRKSEN
jgi:hypothetical protein